MGMGTRDLELLAAMKKSGTLEGVRSICDIGAQELHCAGRLDAIYKVLRAFRIDPLPPRQVVERLSDAGYAKDLWQLCGVEYLAIDTSTEIPTLNLDLNFDSVPGEHRGRYQLVTNFGTTEHVGNQITAMKIMHDLCAPGGLMYHNLPFSGFQTHGFVRYNPKFFWSLCRSNNYQCLDLEVDFVKTSEGLHPDIAQSMAGFGHSLSDAHDYVTNLGALRFLMRKRETTHFKPPFDGVVGSESDGYPAGYAALFGDVAEHSGWNDAGRAAALAWSAVDKLAVAPFCQFAWRAASALKRRGVAALPPVVRDRLRTAVAQWRRRAA